MKTIIKINSLEVEKQELEIIKSDLEKLINIEPNKKIKESSQNMNWSIDQKDIVVLNEIKKVFYRVEFYHNEKEGERKKCFLGSSVYASPINL